MIGNKKTWLGDGLLLLTAIVWGGGFIGVSSAINLISPLYMIGIRFAIASILLLLCFWKKIKKIKRAVALKGGLVGFFLFFSFVFQTIGAEYLSVGKLAFLTALNVIFVPFLARLFFKEQIKKHNIIASIIAIVGFAFLNLSAESGISVGIGELLGVLCAIGFALHISVLGHVADDQDPVCLSFLQMLTCSVLGFIGAFFFETPPKAFSMELILPLAYLGVFSTFVAFLCQTIGQKYTSSSRAAIIMCMESVFGTLFSVLLLSEKLTGAMIIGAGLILLSVIVAEYMHAKLEAENGQQTNEAVEEIKVI